jgi:uncharacterized protein (TIGR03435 family)
MKVLLIAATLCLMTGEEFDVISIRPNRSDSKASGSRRYQEAWTANNVTVKAIITNAFQVLDFDITGAPQWIDSDRFNIDARFEADPEYISKEGLERHRERLQAMLTSRFQLKVHKETKELPAYALVLAKSGPKLTPSAKSDTYSVREVDGHYEAKGVDMDALARSLTVLLGRHVINQTGLEGHFDCVLDFQPEGAEAIPGRPSLITAIQESLGLKLEPRKAPVEVLVIDCVEHPTAN